MPTPASFEVSRSRSRCTTLNSDKVEAEVLDLRHGLQFVPRADVVGSDDIAVCAGVDVLAITAGDKQRPGQTRLDLAGTNLEMCRSLVPQLFDVAPDAVLVMVTNPVDGLPTPRSSSPACRPGGSSGTGTVLDSSRLRDLLARHCGVAVQSVHAWIAGEHGDSEFPLWSATVGSVPLEQFSLGGRPPLDQEAKDRIAIEVMTAAERIIRGKGATNYAIGLAASRVIEAVVRDESRVLSVTSLLDGHFGLKEVCLSLPAVVNRSRVEGVLDIPMAVPETEALGLSGDAVRSVATSLGL